MPQEERNPLKKLSNFIQASFSCLVLGLSILHSSGASAQGFPGVKSFIRHPEDLSSQKSILQHPFRARGMFLQPTQLSPLSLDQHVLEILNQNGFDTGIQVRSRHVGPLNLTSHNEIKTYEFAVNGIPLCNFQVKANSVRNAEPVVFGNIPNVDDLTPAYATWPDADIAFDYMEGMARETGVVGAFTFVRKEQCFHVENRSLVPVWIMYGEADQLLYKAMVSDERGYYFEPQFFHATGTTKIYTTNKKTGTLQDYILNDLTGNGYLEGTKFYTSIADGRARAYNASNNFIFNPGTSEFDEASIFTNASRTLEWFEEHGYQNFGTERLKLNVHASIGGTPNNALYQPGPNGPSISIGDGDGEVLRDMGSDSDVVSHEFGHHVVFNTLTSVSGESLDMHEGLADFFTFAKTNDPCLAESICTEGNKAGCVAYQGQLCLRSASNTYTLENLGNLDAHRRGQFISGMLWDLREQDGIPAEHVTKIVLKAVDSLLSSSKYEHLVLSLLIADKNNFNGQYCQKIYERAKTRGLSKRLKDFNCNDPLPKVADISTSGTSVTSTNASNSSRKTRSGFCSVLPMGMEGSGVATLVTMLFPLVMLLRRRR